MTTARNAPCPCGSGKKYKRCCGQRTPPRPSRPAAPPSAPPRPLRWQGLLFPLLIVVAGLAAYHNSFSGVFTLDDASGIIHNVRIRHLWPPSYLTHTTRPLADLTFALNYALGGLNPISYHLVNLAIHLAAALVLYGLIRRTCLTERLRARWGTTASTLAVAVALLWVVHPLTTQAVTYIVQRAEALMALGYLGTLYSVVRATQSPHPGRWHLFAVLACAA